MTKYKQFTQRIGLIGATNLIGGLSGLILLPILTKTLPIEDYGTYVQIIVTIGLVPAVAMLGLPYTMVRYLAAAESREEIRQGYYSIAGITLITAGGLSLVLYILAEPIAAALFDNQVTVTQILAAIIFLECINGLQINYFRTFQQIKRYSSITLLKTCSQLVLVGILVLAGYGLFGATIGLFITDLILVLTTGVLIVSAIGVAVPKFRHLKEYLSFGLPTVPGNLSGWVVQSSDRYVIAILLGTAAVGYYTPGYTLGNLVATFVAPLSFLLPAILSKHYDENNMTGVQTILSYSLKYYLILAIPSVVGLSLLSRPLLTVLSTSDIAAEGYFITPFVALSALLFGTYAILMQVYILEKKTKFIAALWMLAAVMNLGLNIIIIPYVGIVGAAVTTLIAFSFAFIATVYFSKIHFAWSFSPDLITSVVPRSLLASLTMVPIILLWQPNGIISILAATGLCVSVYCVALFCLKCITKEELQFFKNSLFNVRQ